MLLTPPHKDYVNFVSHIEKINFDKEVFTKLKDTIPYTDEEVSCCNDAADEISYQLSRYYDGNSKLCKPEYWLDPYFKKKHIITEEKVQMTPLEIEVEIIREQGRGNLGKDSRFGIPTYVHALRAIKFMFPDTHITPVLADITLLTFLNYSHSRTYLHLLGSMDAGKSSSTARLLYLFMLVDAPATFAIVSTPLVASAQMTIWGDITELYSQLCQHHPLPGSENKTILFPNAKPSSDSSLYFSRQSRNEKGGWIRHRSLKKEGVGVGAKLLGSDPRRGYGLVVMDEVNKSESFNFQKDLANLSGQPYFQMHTTQNPWDMDDLGGQIAEPKRWGDWGCSSYMEVREESPILYPTITDGIAYRINGLTSVNMMLGKIIYPWQFHKFKLEKIVNSYGLDSPEYSAQVLGMFPGGEMAATILSKDKVAQSRHDDQMGVGYIVKSIWGRVMFCDPAHTGEGDLAVMGTASYGSVTIFNTDGTQDDKNMFMVGKYMNSIKYNNSLIWTANPDPKTNELEHFFLNNGGSVNDITQGSNMTYEEQICIHMMIRAKSEDIPFSNIGFDFSMRPNMIDAVRLIFGREPVAFDYNTKALGYKLRNGEDTSERFTKQAARTDELLYLTADLFNAKQIRGGNTLRIAINQLCQTRVDNTKPHKPGEKKRDYKARNGNKSPDHRDTLCGLVGMAFLKGFRLDGYITPGGNNSLGLGNSIMLNMNRKKRKLKAKELKY